MLGSMGMGDHDIEHLLAALRWFSEHDDDTREVAEELLGRPLRTFTTWAREHAAALTAGQVSRPGRQRTPIGSEVAGTAGGLGWFDRTIL